MKGVSQSATEKEGGKTAVSQLLCTRRHVVLNQSAQCLLKEACFEVINRGFCFIRGSVQPMIGDSESDFEERSDVRVEKLLKNVKDSVE